jgi:hypothetical protein
LGTEFITKNSRVHCTYLNMVRKKEGEGRGGEEEEEERKREGG